MWVFEGQPGSAEWEILEEACAELDKLWRLVQDKIEVGGWGVGAWCAPCVCLPGGWVAAWVGWRQTNRASSELPASYMHPAMPCSAPAQRAHADRRGEEQRRLEAIRKQMEDDKAERHAQFQYGSGSGTT